MITLPLKINPLRANLTKWSNTLKQFVGNLPTNCLSVFDHFLWLPFKTLSKCQVLIKLKGAHVGGDQLEIAKNCFSKRRKR